MMATPRAVPGDTGREWLDGEGLVGRGKVAGLAQAPSADAAFLALVLAALQGPALPAPGVPLGTDPEMLAGIGAGAGALADLQPPGTGVGPALANAAHSAWGSDLADAGRAGDGVAKMPAALAWLQSLTPAAPTTGIAPPKAAEPDTAEPGGALPAAAAVAKLALATAGGSAAARTGQPVLPGSAAAAPGGTADEPTPLPPVPGNTATSIGTAFGQASAGLSLSADGVDLGTSVAGATSTAVGAPGSPVLPTAAAATSTPRSGDGTPATATRRLDASSAADAGSPALAAADGDADPAVLSTAEHRPATDPPSPDAEATADTAAGAAPTPGPDQRGAGARPAPARAAGELEQMTPAVDRPGAFPTIAQPLTLVAERLPLTRTLSPSRLLAAVTAAVQGARPGRYVVSGTLEPPRLGRVQVNIELTGGAVKVSCTVASPAALQALGNQEAALRALLADAGVVLSGFGVAFAAGGGWGGEAGGHDPADADPGGAPALAPAPLKVRTSRVQRLQTVDYRA